MSTRRLVMEKRDDGSSHVLSVPLVQWHFFDRPPPQPSAEELRDEIGLMLSDAGIGPEPLISFKHNGGVRLVWPDELERVAQTLVLALAPEIRRARRARRSVKARATRRQGLAVEALPKATRKDIIEVVQDRDGRWRRAEVARERLVVAASALEAVRRHAREVDRDRPGHEAFGALVVGDNGRVVRYARIANPSPRPGNVWIQAPRQLERRPDGHPLIPCHSHPPGTRTAPSPLDLKTARRFGWSCFAIWEPHDGLRFWRPDGDGAAEVTFETVT